MYEVDKNTFYVDFPEVNVFIISRVVPKLDNVLPDRISYCSGRQIEIFTILKIKRFNFGKSKKLKKNRSETWINVFNCKLKIRTSI